VQIDALVAVLDPVDALGLVGAALGQQLRQMKKVRLVRYERSAMCFAKLHLVGAVEGGGDFADDVVEARAQAAAGDDGGDDFRDIELDHLAGAGAQPLVVLDAVLDGGFGIDVEYVDQGLVRPNEVLVARPCPEEQRAWKVFGLPQGFQHCYNHGCDCDLLDRWVPSP
jgi:hypothetical protein